MVNSRPNIDARTTTHSRPTGEVHAAAQQAARMPAATASHQPFGVWPNGDSPVIVHARPAQLAPRVGRPSWEATTSSHIWPGATAKNGRQIAVAPTATPPTVAKARR